MVLSVEQDMQNVSASEASQVIHSGGAVIQVTKLGRGIGMPLMSVACPPSSDAVLSTLGAPVYAMQLRGFSGSRVAEI